jgi:hypothetical protein
MTTTIIFRRDLVEQACEMLTALCPADLTSVELAGVVAVLCPAYARFLDQPPTGTRPTMRIVPRDIVDLDGPR